MRTLAREVDLKVDGTTSCGQGIRIHAQHDERVRKNCALARIAREDDVRPDQPDVRCHRRGHRQNAPTTDIRLRATGQLASWTFVGGCKTTFNAVATRYAPTWDGYVAYSGATGSLEFRPLDHSTFTRLAS
jgi:transposase